MLLRNFKFVEKEDVPYAIELIGGRLFRMCGRPLEKWEEIEDDENAFRITSNSFKISESDALLLADEFEEDIAGSKVSSPIKRIGFRSVWLLSGTDLRKSRH